MENTTYPNVQAMLSASHCKGPLSISAYVNPGSREPFDVVSVNGFHMYLNRAQTTQLRDELTAFLNLQAQKEGGSNV